ncbi:MAG: hypothetical protein ACI4MN_05995 [Candidatus Coproplasma sp.]
MLTRKPLGTFKARTIKDREVRSGAISGNIMSGSYSYTIATAKNIGFGAAGSQQVIDLENNVTYTIVAVRGLTHTQVGRSFCSARRNKEIILELE